MANIRFLRQFVENKDLVLAQIARFDWPHGFESEHVQRQGQFFYALRGSGRVAVNDKQFPVETGSIFWTASGVWREIHCPDEPLSVMMASFAGPEVWPLFNRTLGTGPGSVIQPRQGRTILDLWQQALIIAEERQEEAQQICSHLIQAVMWLIHDELQREAPESHSQERTYRDVRQVMERNFLQLKSVDEVASRCGITSAYLCRIFQSHRSGMTPHQYLSTLRMNYAVHQLESTALSVKNIAYSLGFTTTAAFSKAFRRVIGQSPMQFRKRRDS